MKALRPLFFALLLANVIFFAWSQNNGPSGHEPQRLKLQLAPEQLKIAGEEKLAAQVAPVAAASAAPSTATSAAAPVTAASAAPVATASATPAPALLCKAYTDLSLENAKTAQAEIATRAPAVKTSLQAVKESGSYWVYIPAQPSKAAADKKVSELKQLGVEESFILVDEGPNRYAISLGLFRNKEMADNFLSGLAKRGVRSAKIEAREKGGEHARLEINAPADALATFGREVKALNGASSVDCKAG